MAGGPSSSITKLWIVLLLGVLLTTAAYDAAAGLRIRAGCARTYYIGLPSSDGLQGICVLPTGAEEGTTLPLLNRDFSVLANRPVSFTLYSSRTRHDAHGEVAALDEADVHRHPPLVTLLRYGKKMRDVVSGHRSQSHFHRDWYARTLV